MKARDLRQLTNEELDAKVREMRDAVFNVKIKHATGQLDNTSSLKIRRRELARALTLQAERRQRA
ncbi:MAG: 50S ribosomal protein L29 [Acidobacteriota bacterium]|nr:MAG: 50S ribosomal protein L29 [Acidobacteriota bacterium]